MAFGVYNQATTVLYLNTASSLGPTVFPHPPNPSDMADLLTDEEIAAQLPDEWEREGDEIVCTYEFDAYIDGVGFAAAAGGLAQEAFHHPEITIGWREVEVRLTTHDAGGITENDTDLAARFNDIYE
jgi:4a-hydroxytetrahydrobiopterin dehydratase